MDQYPKTINNNNQKQTKPKAPKQNQEQRKLFILSQLK